MNVLKNLCQKHGVLAALILGVAAIVVFFALELMLFKVVSTVDAFTLIDAALRFILGGLVLFLLLKLGITENPGFRVKGLGKSLLLSWPFFLLFAGILAFSFISASLTGRSVEVGWLLLQIVLMLSVGFFEEIVFRAGVVNLVKNSLGNSRSALVKTAVIAAVIFSLAHCLNLLGQADLSHTLSQVIANFGMGLFLSTLYLRTGNLMGPMIFL
ncbi:MAG: CPBP family intramembrane glutamic endopeptidase [Eubacterium sp.]